MSPEPCITLLNGFQLRLCGHTVRLPVNTQRVLAFLALNDGDLLRTYVANVLWPDTSEERAAANLRSALWRLRSHRVEVIDSTAQLLSLAPRVVVDVREMECLATTILRSSLDDAPDPDVLTLAGDLLPGFQEEWVLIERERIRQLRLHALEALCERLTACGRYSGAVAAGLAAVADEPLRESAQIALIKAYLAEGNRVEALKQFESYRRILKAELDLEPAPGLRSELALPNGKTPGKLNRWARHTALTCLAGGLSAITWGGFAEDVAAAMETM